MQLIGTGILVPTEMNINRNTAPQLRGSVLSGFGNIQRAEGSQLEHRAVGSL